MYVTYASCAVILLVKHLTSKKTLAQSREIFQLNPWSSQKVYQWNCFALEMMMFGYRRSSRICTFSANSVQNHQWL